MIAKIKENRFIQLGALFLAAWLGFTLFFGVIGDIEHYLRTARMTDYEAAVQDREGQTMLTDNTGACCLSPLPSDYKGPCAECTGMKPGDLTESDKAAQAVKKTEYDATQMTLDQYAEYGLGGEAEAMGAETGQLRTLIWLRENGYLKPGVADKLLSGAIP